MADVNIPDLTAATALDGTEKMELVQAGVNKRTTAAAVAALQILSTSDADPNVANLKPGNLQGGAIFYQDGTVWNEWRWSKTNQNWMQKDAP